MLQRGYDNSTLVEQVDNAAVWLRQQHFGGAGG